MGRLETEKEDKSLSQEPVEERGEEAAIGEQEGDGGGGGRIEDEDLVREGTEGTRTGEECKVGTERDLAEDDKLGNGGAAEGIAEMTGDRGEEISVEDDEADDKEVGEVPSVEEEAIAGEAEAEVDEQVAESDRGSTGGLHEEGKEDRHAEEL